MLGWLKAEVGYWAFQSGLRGYCWACDDLRWAWTHRRCGRRAHEAGARLAAALRKSLDSGGDLAARLAQVHAEAEGFISPAADGPDAMRAVLRALLAEVGIAPREVSSSPGGTVGGPCSNGNTSTAPTRDPESETS